MPLDSIIVRGAREHNLIPTCHWQRPKGAKPVLSDAEGNLGEWCFERGPAAETLRGVYPEHSRRAQGDRINSQRN